MESSRLVQSKDNIRKLDENSNTSITPSKIAINSKYWYENNSVGQKRKKRQDWCRWPLCEAYSETGCCSGYLKDIDASVEQACSLAHINLTQKSVKVSTENGIRYVRVCFDSMGLIQDSCKRQDCNFYHPPKCIRDKIVNNRHAQYLKEKMAKMTTANNASNDQRLPQKYSSFLKNQDNLTLRTNLEQIYANQARLQPANISHELEKQNLLNAVYQNMLSTNCYQIPFQNHLLPFPQDLSQSTYSTTDLPQQHFSTSNGQIHSEFTMENTNQTIFPDLNTQLQTTPLSLATTGRNLNYEHNAQTINFLINQFFTLQSNWLLNNCYN